MGRGNAIEQIEAGDEGECRFGKRRSERIANPEIDQIRAFEMDRKGALVINEAHAASGIVDLTRAQNSGRHLEHGKTHIDAQYELFATVSQFE